MDFEFIFAPMKGVQLTANYSLWPSGSRFRFYNVLVDFTGNGQSSGLWKESDEMIHGISANDMNFLIVNKLAIRI